MTAADRLSMHYRNSIRDPKPPRPWRDIGLIVLAVLLLGCIWLVAGCGARTAAAVIAERAPVQGPAGAASDTTPAESGDVAQARRERDEAKQRLAAAEQHLVDAEAARDAARLDRLRLISLWVSGFALLGALASVALWFFLPAGTKGWAVSAGGACAGVLVVAIAFNAVLPYLAIASVVLLVAGVLWGLWYLARALRSAKEAAEHGDRLESAIRDWFPRDEVEHVLETVKMVSSDRQRQAGVAPLLAAIRGKPKPQPPLVVPA
jgi:hypothetical protein